MLYWTMQSHAFLITFSISNMIVSISFIIPPTFFTGSTFLSVMDQGLVRESLAGLSLQAAMYWFY